MTDGALFGLELRRARERRGLSLDQLAEVTKVSGSLFAALERGDVSRWPGGIFRRAFVRSYAQAVGLDPEETLARFLRLFPDAESSGETAGAPAAARPEAQEGAPRLVLDETAEAAGSTRGWLAVRRVGAPLVDLLLAGIPAAAVSLLYGWQWFFPVAALIGLVGHVVALAAFGATPGTRLLLPKPAARRFEPEEAQARRRAEAEPAAAAPRRRQPRHASTSRPISARTRRVQH